MEKKLYDAPALEEVVLACEDILNASSDNEVGIGDLMDGLFK